MGLNELLHQYAEERKSYLLGEISSPGKWYFFPVALAVKSPLPFLILCLTGTLGVARQSARKHDYRPFAPAAAALAILAITLPSSLAIGLRHILPVYPLLCMTTAAGMVVCLWPLGRVLRTALCGLLLWQGLVAWKAHPDYLAYFSPLAGENPERVLVISDLDWGQDLLRLRRELQARRVDSLALSILTSADLSRHDLPPHHPLPAHTRTVGWIAVSEFHYVFRHHEIGWLDDYQPVARVGGSIRLYYIPP